MNNTLAQLKEQLAAQATQLTTLEDNLAALNHLVAKLEHETPPAFVVGMRVRYDGEDRGGRPPRAGMIGRIQRIDERGLEVNFTGGVCEPNPYLVIEKNLTI